ncbi:MAG: helix-turn-helix transcriptional regulator [Campylobacterales bacterium]
MAENKSSHILTIIKELSSGKKICTKEFAEHLGVSSRSVDRYLNDISAFFGEGVVIKIKRGCYASLKEDVLKSFLPLQAESKDELEKIYDVINIVNPSFIDSLPEAYKNALKKLKTEIDSIYMIKENPFEEMFDTGVFSSLKSAIKYSRYIDVLYDNGDVKERYANIKPIRLLLAEGNWYVATIDDESEVNSGFRFLRVAFVKQVELKSKTFYKVMDAEDFLRSFQTLFSLYKTPRFEVFVTVSSDAARYFRRKKHLRSQQIVKTNEDGSLLVRYEVNNKLEVFMLVKKWLPELKIESPDELKEEFMEMVRGYIKE